MRFELRVGNNRNCLLKNIVSKLMSHKSLDDLVHTELTVPGLETELPNEDLIIPEVGALEDLLDLVSGLSGLKALFNHIGGEFELTEAHKISGDEVEDLLIAKFILQFENILDQVVAIRVLNQIMDAANNDISKSEFLLAQALLKTTLHDTASVFVGSDLVTVGHARTVNELCVLGELLRSWAVLLIGRVRSLEGQKESLDNVISI